MFFSKPKVKNVYVGTGISKNDDPFKAGEEAVEMAIKNMGLTDSSQGPDFGMVFCSGGKYGQDGSVMQKLVDGAHQKFISSNPNIKWIGCTSAGEISSAGFSKNSCVAMALSSDYIKFGVGIGDCVKKDPVKATKTAFKMATTDLKIDRYVDAYMQFLTMKMQSTEELIKYSPYHLVTLCPGPTMVPGKEDEIVSALRHLAGPTVPITGGSSADDLIMKSNYTFSNGKIYKDALILTAIISNVKTATTAESGFKPTKKTFVVTSSTGRVIHELNNQPAAKVLAEAYGSTVEELSKPALGNLQKCFFLNSTNPLMIVHGPDIYRVAVFHMIQGNDVIIGSSVTNNTAITIGEGTNETIINSASDAMKKVKERVGGNLSAAIVFDCDLRLMALQDKITKENDKIKKELGKIPIIGFFTNGEQCFLGDSSACHVNYTITAIGISNNLMSEK